MIVSSASGLTFWGMVGTLGPLAAAGSIIGVLPHYLKVLVLLIGPLFVPFGNFFMGLLTDRLGRKKIFLMTMIIYGVGIVVISLSYTFIPLIIGLMLAEFGVGGEEIPSLSLVSEDSPVSQRAMWLTIISDFDNIGSALIAGLFVIIVNSFMDRIILLSAASALIIIMVLSRISLPESYKWQESRGQKEKSEITKKSLYIDTAGVNIKRPAYRLSLFVLMAMAISQYTTFGLMAYVIGPYEFPGARTDDMIIFVALVGASVAGFIAAPLISRGRKKYTMYSFGTGFLSTVLIFILIPFLHDTLIFYPLLFLNMMMSEFAWASRTTLEPELAPTRIRGTFIGTVRLAPMIVYPLLVIATSTMPLTDFIALNMGLWLLGFAGAMVWHHYGIETKNVNIDYSEN
ncbi:MFS transporter [Ferroplasma sp.]|uniref:MFS transporter n=1 Tax=Ferroplasma sp. TaxID=2591003 RepID=UPI00262677D6|nr:MFS transporter [Ferroplasma sp.]MCL4453388.1 MFS transporter [Candidatus Thermoplasmatota archaeon]